VRESTHVHAPFHTRWLVRPVAALGLLVAEYLAISFFFDAAVLLDQADGWSALGLVGMLGPIAIAFATALWLLGGAKLRTIVVRSAQIEEGPWFPALLIHLICFAAFFGLSAHLFGRMVLPRPLVLWVALWVLGGLATFVSWLPLAMGRIRVSGLLRELAVPLGLAGVLGLLAWGAGIVTLQLWRPLGTATLNASAALLEVFVTPIVYDAADASLGTPDFWVTVAPVCSGYEGIGLVFAFLTAYLVVFHERFRFPHVLVLLPLAIIGVWMLNVVRIVALILVGHGLSPDIAIGSFHSKAGWIFFCAVALGAVWTSEHVPWFARSPAAPRNRSRNPSAPFLLPLLGVVATALITGLAVTDFDYFYPLRVGVAITLLAWFGRDYAAGVRSHLRGRSLWSWQAFGWGLLVYVAWIAMWSIDRPTGEVAPAALAELSPAAAFVWISSRIIGSVITVPIIEELAFRGFLLRRLIARDFTKVPYDTFRWSAVIISSLAFAAVHQQWIAGFFAGAAYAFAMTRRGLLTDAILAHVTTNALVSLQVLMLGHWSLW